ncbi:bifunctional aminoglycoside phosphotransferase/ATP-binding protein [Geoalkalibacter sp.]|uniref:bifunctional aminoglycoside phosphotransferase/ATP-binding protein n=1 Tax=Geoalkalibacter sp. TaxID=3041440 RepID=UPI00272E8946|nr:bifunctional aminoglycoside phosphotransferase/ATP-binding protein [Geoalkalibacter sp.]
MNSDIVHKALMHARAYPIAPGRIEFKETHVSRLYFTDEFVYKVKKPVDFGFLNFTTLDRRRFYCEEEVRLNRRFAPDTYLGVREIRRDATGVHIDGQGEVLDFAVWMKRLPAERMLDNLIARDAPELPQAMEALGGLLARIEQEAEVCRQNGGMSNLEAIRRNWRENFEQVTPFCGQSLSADALKLIRDAVATFIEKQETLLQQREEQGFVRDGHGDLHAEHICLTEPIRIYDCIEFNRRFRVADVVADLAFLLMDLDFRGRRDLAAILLAAYANAAEPDPDFETLLPFYKVYRAFVRGKVDSFLGADAKAAAEVRQEAVDLARSYFLLALGYLTPCTLILTCGLMGSGKTTLAQSLARVTGAELLRSDLVRKELAGERATEGASAPYEQGIYAPSWSGRTYARLAELAEQALRPGRGVIVDASFVRAEDRQRFYDLAQRTGRPVLLVHLHGEEATLAQRLRERTAAGTDASDGRAELLPAQQRAFEPPDPGEKPLRLDAHLPLPEQADRTLCTILQRAGTIL